MRKYSYIFIFFFFLGLLIVGCSKSEDVSVEDERLEKVNQMLIAILEKDEEGINQLSGDVFNPDEVLDNASKWGFEGKRIEDFIIEKKSDYVYHVSLINKESKVVFRVVQNPPDDEIVDYMAILK
ncbi:hypothetical protein DOE78_04065 [Bacillus sp. Y1]|nr:hypothetical protein [Bacillus sp. Y1]AYA74696.1 hypothetical protein DOE78_04065 [Bacillus sp. Y1]